MSKLILCSGERTKRPYVFGSAGTRIYSIEELCYYLYHNVYLIEEEMFSMDLFEWIETELKLKERAQKLKQLKQQKADIKTIVAVILCSADYYTETEIKGMLRVLDEVIGMPTIKRNCIKANKLLKNKQYKEAAAEYERIINSSDINEITPEEYGDIYHNLAVAKVNVTGLKEASKLFLKAYERNHREDTLKQYLLTLQLTYRDEEYENKIEEYQVIDKMKLELEEYRLGIEEEALHSEYLEKIEKLRQKKTQGRINEFYKEADGLIASWQMKIRHV